MFIKENNINKVFTTFIVVHLIVWTFIPSVSNINLPLDTIEALAWGSELKWGYSKHPPLSAFAVNIFYQIFANNDWAYYFLSQLFVISAFFIIFKFSEDFLKNKTLCLISVLLLEGIYFYNFTTPEFNVNVCQLPFWALTVYYCWKGIKEKSFSNWILFGLFAALGVLSKYLFIYLLVAIDVFFIYVIFKRKFDIKCLISLLSFFVVLAPHLIWLVDNNFITITYALHRTGIENSDFLSSHLFNPIIFLAKQIGILVPFFIMIYFIVSKFKLKINLKDKKLIFLLIINLAPIALIFLTSLIMGAKIRTMWMTPFYLFIGVLFVYIFQKKIILKQLKHFFITFMILFTISPIAYFYVSVTQTDKRTDYPGKKIAQIVERKWKENFSNNIGLVGGDEWHGGNLSYHLKSRPKWDNILESNQIPQPKNINDGFILIGDVNILSQICRGLFFEAKKQGVCMVGKKK